MQMCSRCHKRIAVVFISRLDPENNQMINEGLCIQCARDLGIKPVNDMLQKFGFTPEDVDRMSDDLSAALKGAEGDDSAEDLGEDAGAPPIDLPKLFSQLEMSMTGQGDQGTGSSSAADTDKAERKEKQKKPDSRRKTLDTFCTNLTKRAAEGKLDRIIGRKAEQRRHQHA